MYNHYDYNHSLSGIIRNAYYNMKRRINSKDFYRHKYYIGLELVDRDLFKRWCKDNKKLKKLHQIWEQNNYDQKYTPSIDRLNPNLGYTLDNIDWCSVSDNIKRRHKMQGNR